MDKIFFFFFFCISVLEQGPRENGASKRGRGWEERRKRLQTNPGILKTTNTACHA